MTPAETFEAREKMARALKAAGVPFDAAVAIARCYDPATPAARYLYRLAGAVEDAAAAVAAPTACERIAGRG